jgi:hypothetical protein
MINKIAFTSNINFVSNEEFQKVTSYISRTYDNPSNIGKPWDQVKTAGEGLTEDAQRCIAGGLTNTNSKDVAFFHFLPRASYKLYSVKDQIKGGLNKMGKYTERLGGLIVGGRVSGGQRTGIICSNESEALADGIRDLYKNVKASVSEFTGHKENSGRTNIFYRGNDDSWFINYSNGSNNSINSVDDIKRAYKTTHVTEQDNIFINGQQVDKNILNSD